VIPWLGSGSDDDDQDEDDEGIDESALLGDDGIIIDTGVTSGSDPTAWDPIGIDRRPNR